MFIEYKKRSIVWPFLNQLLLTFYIQMRIKHEENEKINIAV